MKQNTNILALVAVGAALLLRHRSQGVGRVRRNIFAEIEDLQNEGISLNSTWDELNANQQSYVMILADRVGYKQPAASRNAGKNATETYYNSLRRQYLKLVNPAIGRIQYPHTTSVIRNSRGDVVLTYNDYDPEKDQQAALDWWHDTMGGGRLYDDPYFSTVYAIARGNKWIWKGKKSGGALLTRGLADELFFSRTNLEGERKLYKALIDNKNGWTFDKFVEQYLHDEDGAKDAAIQALKDFPNPKAAKEYILGEYYKSLDDGQPEYDYDGQEDLPF